MDQPCFLAYWTDGAKLPNDSVAICLDDGKCEEEPRFLLWQHKKMQRVRKHGAGEVRREYFATVRGARASVHAGGRKIILFGRLKSE